MFKRAFLLFFLVVLMAPPAHGAPDFYGIKMKSEDFAQNIQLKDNNLIPDFSESRPGTDKRIYAYAYLSGTVGGGRGVSVQVYNHSDEPFATDRLFRELALVTWNGKRYDRSQTQMMLNRDRLEPGEDATFNFTFPGIRVPKEEIRMIVCSFDLGGTLLVLFPMERKAVPPAAPKRSGRFSDLFKRKEAPPAEKKTALPSAEIPKRQEENALPAEEPKKMTVAEHCITPIKAVQSFFRRLGERPTAQTPPAPQEAPPAEEPPAQGIVEDNYLPPSYPLVKASQVIEGTKYEFLPEFKKEVEDAEGEIRQVVHRDRPWSLGNPDKLWVREENLSAIPEIPRAEAKVVHVNREYGFVVVNAGFEDGLDKNKILEILRNGRKIGKVMITKPRTMISGAIILPEWKTRDEIQVGDLVGISP